MARSRTLAGVLAALPALALVFETRPAANAPQLPSASRQEHASEPSARSWTAQASCTVCHSGARKALAYSVHASLLAGPDAGNACTACHTGATAHAEATLDPLRPPVAPGPVAAAACAACHPGRALFPAAGAHPWSSQLDRVPEPVADPSSPTPAEPLPLPPPIRELAPDLATGFDFGGAARFGYRFVEVFGSRERYDTDVNLDDGFRLTDLELTARGHEDAFLDRAELSLSDLADPYMRLRGELARDDAFTVQGRYERDAFKYRARGDFHRVDVRAQEWGFDALVPLAKYTDVTFSFTRRLQDGFWLTNRIGNRNVTPITTVPGVRSPRDHDLDLYELALRTRLLGAGARIGVDYRAYEDVDSWAYARPAPSNPIATESEVFTSKSTLQGPGAHLALDDTTAGLAWSLTARVVDVDRRVRGNGLARGFDIGEFETTTTAFATGGARTWLVDGTASKPLSEEVALLFDLRFRDHREQMHLDQVDDTFYPVLGNRTVTALDLEQRTAQTTFEGTVSLEFEPHERVRVAAGYGFARERLRLPDLEATDADFTRGTIQNDGVLLDGLWRPTDRWTLSARWRDFGQNGIQLHELADDEVRTLKVKLRHQRDAFWSEVFTENRHKTNGVSRTRLDAWTSGAAVGLRTTEATDVWASYAYTDLESRTLTNFWFDPDPLPVPTFVGFDGRTHTVTVGAGLDLTTRMRLDLSGAFTSTHGSFDVQVFDWRADVSVDICSSAELGLLVRQVDYHEDVAQSAGLDDYGSYLTFLYVRTRFGTAR